MRESVFSLPVIVACALTGCPKSGSVEAPIRDAVQIELDDSSRCETPVSPVAEVDFDALSGLANAISDRCGLTLVEPKATGFYGLNWDLTRKMLLQELPEKEVTEAAIASALHRAKNYMSTQITFRFSSDEDVACATSVVGDFATSEGFIPESNSFVAGQWCDVDDASGEGSCWTVSAGVFLRDSQIVEDGQTRAIGVKVSNF